MNSLEDLGEFSYLGDVVSDLELNDSLEVVNDSLDVEIDWVENVFGLKDEEDKIYLVSSLGNWIFFFLILMVKDFL